MPKLSIIIPIYNTQQYIEECLNSIRNQSFNDFECICIDDGSTDSSPEIINKFAEKDVRFVYVHQQNNGQASARNHALGLIKGEYITYIDSDDVLATNALEIMFNAAELNNADVVIGESELINDNVQAKSIDAEINTNYEQTYLSREPFKDYLDNKFVINSEPWGKMFKACIGMHIRFPEHLRIHDDTQFNPNLLIHAKSLVKINNIVYHYRSRIGSVTRSNRDTKALEEIVSNFTQLRTFCIEFNLSATESIKLINRCSLGYFLTVVDRNINVLSGKELVEFVNTASAYWNQLKLLGLTQNLKLTRRKKILELLVLKLKLPNVYKTLARMY